MGSYRNSYISAGALARGSVKRAFRQMREWGCTVSYDVESGLFETVYWNVQIEGPDWAIARFNRWVSDLNGRLV